MIKLTLSAPPTSRYRSFSFLTTIVILTSILIVYEMMHLVGVEPEIIRLTLGFVLLFAVVYSAFRYGMWPAILAAVISNVYLIYAFSGPGRTIVPLNNILNGEWVLALLFFMPAIIIGYLRDRINHLIQQERQARQEAVEGRLQLEKILEEMPVGVVIAKAPSGELIFSNRHLNQLVGHHVTKYVNLDDYPKNSLLNEHGHPLPQQLWPLRRIIHNEETLVNEEYTYRANKNNLITLQVKGTPIYNNKQQLVSGVVIIDDITAEKELLQRKDDFLSFVSHELKTPITSLKMYTQLLLKQYATNPQYNPIEELQKIDNQTQKIHTIINNMMELATLQLNKEQLQSEVINVVDVIGEVVQDVKNSHPPRELVVKHVDSAPILGDKARLTQVVTNLVANAIKYSLEHTPVFIELRVLNGSAQISIQDFGIGIASPDRHKIFNRFYQERQKDGKIYPGLGLGLYFSAEIVKQHQGKIWVESKKGQGSTFYISLPLAKD